VRWTFGVDPLPQAVEAADLLRRVTCHVLALEQGHPALDRLLSALAEADAELGAVAPSGAPPRVGPAADTPGARAYVDHSRDVGAYDPCFPEYGITVDGDHAHGTVRFPIAYEGPPGLVHGGFVALLVDCVVQHHNCDVGVAGKTASLAVRFRRPTPLLADLTFTVVRAVADGRITSSVQLLAGDVVLAEAEVRAVAGDRAGLPVVSPRRATP
jgi:hypothetical protein